MVDSVTVSRKCFRARWIAMAICPNRIMEGGKQWFKFSFRFKKSPLLNKRSIKMGMFHDQSTILIFPFNWHLLNIPHIDRSDCIEDFSSNPAGKTVEQAMINDQIRHIARVARPHGTVYPPVILLNDKIEIIRVIM